ncbi:MAG: hypothetical protein WEC84_01630 [Candidatus Andersenbacteria bacterium]
MKRELNLLPPQRRSLLAKQSMVDGATRVVKNICYGLGTVSAGAVAIIITLQIMAYVAARTSTSTLEAEVATYQELREGISKQNKLYETLYGIDSGRISWIEKVKDLFAILPPGLTVDKVTTRTTPSPTLVFSGQAVNRNTLIVLEARLRGLSWAQSIDAPHTNLIDRLSPTYTFTINLGKGEES